MSIPLVLITGGALLYIFTSWPLLYAAPLIGYWFSEKKVTKLYFTAFFWGLFLDTLAVTPFGIYAIASLVAARFSLTVLHFISIGSPWMEWLFACAYSLFFSLISSIALWMIIGGKISLYSSFLGLFWDGVYAFFLIMIAYRLARKKKRYVEELA